MPTVHAEKLSLTFQASRFSWAYLFWWIYYVGLIVLSFLLAFASYGEDVSELALAYKPDFADFWMAESVYTEQPNVLFKRSLIVQLKRANPGGDLVWSSFPEYNSLFSSSQIRVPNIRVSDIDTNMDQKTDEIQLKLRWALQPGEEVHGVSIVLFCKALLQDRVTEDLDAALFFDFRSPVAGSSLQVLGDIEFFQLNPLSTFGTRDVYSQSILDASSIRSVADVRIDHLQQLSFKRNETLIARPLMSYWAEGSTGSFDVQLRWRVPAQQIRYIPGPIHVLHWAWVRFLPVLWLLHFFLKYIKSFCYRYQVVSTRVRRKGALLSIGHTAGGRAAIKEHQF